MPNPTVTVYMGDDELQLPGRYVVCGGCSGKGTHVNRAIDGNGLSDELADDPDFMEAYMAGVYDVTCETCKGLRVVVQSAEETWTPEQRSAYADQLRSEWEWADEQAMEARMLGEY